MIIELVVNKEFCHGCGLCVHFCDRKVLEMSFELDERGFRHPVFARPSDCGGCTRCATMCPDGCFRIVRIGNPASSA